MPSNIGILASGFLSAESAYDQLIKATSGLVAYYPMDTLGPASYGSYEGLILGTSGLTAHYDLSGLVPADYGSYDDLVVGTSGLIGFYPQDDVS